MKLLQLLENLNFQFPTTREGVEAVISEYGISNYTINNDLSVDVDGSVYLHDLKLNFIPVQFGKVTGIFDCSWNILRSLQGAPREVGGGFHCKRSRLTSLNGAPREVGGDFDCSNNELFDLRGAPREVGRDFDCSDNELLDLKGSPREVGGGFYCGGNLFLTSLDGIGVVHGQIISDLQQ